MMEQRVTDRPARGLMSESARNRIAWTVAGAALLALVLVMRGLFPPPAMAGVEDAGSAPGGSAPGVARTSANSAGSDGADVSTAPLPATAAEAERAQESAAAAAARAVSPAESASHVKGASRSPSVIVRPDYVSELEWQALKGVAAQSRDPARTLAALVEKLRFSKQLELFRSGATVVARADLAARLLADLPARVLAGDMSRDEALRLLPALVEPLEPDPAARAARVSREAAGMPGQALQAVP